MTYDEKCFELAEHFIPNGSDDEKEKLAQAIQDAIEDWVSESD